MSSRSSLFQQKPEALSQLKINNSIKKQWNGSLSLHAFFYLNAIVCACVRVRVYASPSYLVLCLFVSSCLHQELHNLSFTFRGLHKCCSATLYTHKVTRTMRQKETQRDEKVHSHNIRVIDLFILCIYSLVVAKKEVKTTTQITSYVPHISFDVCVCACTYLSIFHWFSFTRSLACLSAPASNKSWTESMSPKREAPMSGVQPSYACTQIMTHTRGRWKESKNTHKKTFWYNCIKQKTWPQNQGVHDNKPRKAHGFESELYVYVILSLCLTTSLASLSAPAFTRICTHAVWPWREATLSAVQPCYIFTEEHVTEGQKKQRVRARECDLNKQKEKRNLHSYTKKNRYENSKCF